ncbi:class I SAM-dependent methyltransferase [Thermoproteota archaeon]
MSSKPLTLSQIEELGYYDFMAYLQVPFFNIGGTPSIDLLAEKCSINENSHILDIGCGTGGNSAYLATNYGCRVTGIDIAEHMIGKAKERAKDLDLEDKLIFQVGDAYSLNFPDNTFDIVLTVFVSQFLDLEKAFPEFNRVLKPGGFLGVNEMYRDDNVPAEAVEKVDIGEKVFRELTELPFRLRTPTEWEQGFKLSEYDEVSVETFTNYIDTKRGLEMVGEFGGLLNLISLLWNVVALGLKSKKIREKYGRISRGKRVLLRDKIASKYIGYVLGVGRKPK